MKQHDHTPRPSTASAHNSKISILTRLKDFFGGLKTNKVACQKHDTSPPDTTTPPPSLAGSLTRKLSSSFRKQPPSPNSTLRNEQTSPSEDPPKDLSSPSSATYTSLYVSSSQSSSYLFHQRNATSSDPIPNWAVPFFHSFEQARQPDTTQKFHQLGSERLGKKGRGMYVDMMMMWLESVDLDPQCFEKDSAEEYVQEAGVEEVGRDALQVFREQVASPSPVGTMCRLPSIREHREEDACEFTEGPADTVRY
ncbi:hypothetical protein HDV05_000708 [Chytridiales sp. JEL 0842]|nr:hypothetical protein HDV05_000708 [Chytridiales sp. JEL 0842]